MSRREIRRMLMEPKNQRQNQRRVPRPRWLVPALGASVLAAGLGLGVWAAVGLFSGKPEPRQTEWEKAEMAVDRPMRQDIGPDAVAPEAEPEPDGAASQPIVPLPRPRPGGPADEGIEYEAPEGDTGATPDEPVEETAAPVVVPQSSVPPVQIGVPAWMKHAVPPPKTAGRPMIAVVIDDLGVDRKRSEKVIPLRAPLTLAWMTYAQDLPRLTREAHARGHELLVHVPMQPIGENFNPGPDVLDVNVTSEENRRRLTWGLTRFDGFVGINNHMGSRYTGDRAGMRVVMEELKKRGLLFLDSVTTEKSVAPELARNYGVPFAARNIFIDNDQTVAAVTVQLQKAEAHARKHGAAIAIGHPHDSTIEALQQWLPSLEAKGFVLVPVTAIIKANGSANGG